MSQAYMDSATGLPRPVRLTPEGDVPVAVQDDESGDDVPELLRRLVWETRELRRVYCAEKRLAFKEYPG